MVVEIFFFYICRNNQCAKGLSRQLLRHKRCKVALKSFLPGNLLSHDFGGPIVFIHVKSWTLYRVDLNEFNLIRKYVYAASVIHIIVFVWATLIGCGWFCLKDWLIKNWGGFLQQKRHCNSIFYIWRTLPVRYWV